MKIKDHSFEPRIGTAQFVFGIIYALITAIALVLAIYVKQQGGEPYVQYFMVTLFLILTLKSFIIYAKVKSLVKHGERVNATITSIEAVRGITIVKGTYEVKNYGVIEIQTRLAGETAARELKRYFENRPKLVPALIVGATSKHPRGMILVRTISGHIDENTLKTEH